MKYLLIILIVSGCCNSYCINYNTQEECLKYRAKTFYSSLKEKNLAKLYDEYIIDKSKFKYSRDEFIANGIKSSGYIMKSIEIVDIRIYGYSAEVEVNESDDQSLKGFVKKWKWSLLRGIGIQKL